LGKKGFKLGVKNTGSGAIPNYGAKFGDNVLISIHTIQCRKNDRREQTEKRIKHYMMLRAK